MVSTGAGQCADLEPNGTVGGLSWHAGSLIRDAGHEIAAGGPGERHVQRPGGGERGSPERGKRADLCLFECTGDPLLLDDPPPASGIAGDLMPKIFHRNLEACRARLSLPRLLSLAFPPDVFLDDEACKDGQRPRQRRGLPCLSRMPPRRDTAPPWYGRAGPGKGSSHGASSGTREPVARTRQARG